MILDLSRQHFPYPKLLLACLIAMVPRSDDEPLANWVLTLAKNGDVPWAYA